jgi:hypothetical protein
VRGLLTGLGPRPGQMRRMSGFGPLLPRLAQPLLLRRLLGQRCPWAGGLAEVVRQLLGSEAVLQKLITGLVVTAPVLLSFQ